MNAALPVGERLKALHAHYNVSSTANAVDWPDLPVQKIIIAQITFQNMLQMQWASVNHWKI